VSKRKRELTGDEKKLWRRVAESVKTRKPMPPEDAEPAPPAAKPTREKANQHAAPALKAPAPAKAPHPPLADRGAEKRVRRGRVEIGATLDLHGHTLATARAALARFLFAAQARGDRTVIVVTGMGRGGEGVLRRALPEWLAERDLRALTAGYAQAHRSHGGGGAFYVFLKRLDAAD
jgi:DNA-nicking Smr family endonuclease